MTGALLVEAPGLSTTVQDDGRPGHAHEGVPPSGALDRAAFRLANRLVGNPESAAVLETTLSGPALRLQADRLYHVALTGAPAPLTVDGRAVASHAATAVRPGQLIEIGVAGWGLRSYLAVSGGIDEVAVLGSRSTDLLSGLGPPPLAVGRRLPLRASPDPAPHASGAADLAPAVVGRGRGPAVLGVWLGPREDWLADGSMDLLLTTSWSVSPDSNRVGLRLQGPRLAWRGSAELPPEGVLTGAVQVPPAGQPVVFGNDHPVTGGYPVVAVVAAQWLDVAAQLRPGSQVRFRPLGPPRRTGPEPH